jgi:hypothetical protein
MKFLIGRATSEDFGEVFGVIDATTGRLVAWALSRAEAQRTSQLLKVLGYLPRGLPPVPRKPYSPPYACN